MTEKIKSLIDFEPENSLLDFKRDQYELGKSLKKNEVIKDIMAMANHLSDDDKFIIIGVKEKNGIKELFPIEKVIDDADYQRLVNDNVEPTINFEYKLFEFNGNRLAYFRIFDNHDRPYLFKKEISGTAETQNFKKGDGFMRKGTSTFRIGRTELDLIYNSKNVRKDRKIDLEITHQFSTHYFSLTKTYPYLDISVRNKSNESISFDAELIILKNNLEVKSEGAIKDDNIKRAPHVMFIPEISYRASIKEFKDRYQIATIFKGITLRQADRSEDIFGKNTILVFKEPQNFRAILTLRCDDFTQGPLVYKIDTTISNDRDKGYLM